MIAAFPRLDDRIQNFLMMEAHPGRSIGEWLVEDFPRGLASVAANVEQVAVADKEALAAGLHQPGLKEPFSSPRFDQAFARAGELCNPAYGQAAELYDWVQSRKNTFDEISSQKLFYEQEFLPRLLLLAQGDAATPEDFTLMARAQKDLPMLAERYQRFADPAFQKPSAVFQALDSLLGDLMDRLPKPKDWSSRSSPALDASTRGYC